MIRAGPLRPPSRAAALGYRSATPGNLRQQTYEMESGRRPITPQVARLAEMYRRFGVPADLAAADEIGRE